MASMESARKELAADCVETLEHGEVPVSHARVMFLGLHGSGKSSLLDGIMSHPLHDAESTALADVLNIRYHWVEIADAAENSWREEDEVQELASLCLLAMKDESKRPATGVNTPASASFYDQDAQEAAQIQRNVTASIVQEAWQMMQFSPLSKGPDIMMRIWDCGGQPVFLDILSAFLTSRTMFLLVFDASQPLNSKYRESWRHKGQTYQGKEYNITFLQLMMQWMRLIPASLMGKDEVIAHSEAIAERRQPISLPPCPRMMIVGTHGDVLVKQAQQQVLEEVQSSYRGKAFQALVTNTLIIDNTTAGRGENEDPGYRVIRKKIHEFTHSLTVPTPLAWVTFRKVVQKAAADSPVLSYEQVTTIAEACGIDKSKVPSVLLFYHQLGVFLHYKNIESLSTTIITEPQWLIKQLCKLLMPEWYHPRSQNLATLWQWLEGKGVLLEPLYQDLWGDCGLTGGAQALVDLLEHFDLAKKIDNSSVPREMQWFKGYKYFVPCMLEAQFQENPDQEAAMVLPIREAATLHIIFNTGYIPPGFFIHLAVQMMKSEKCTPIFERGIYRDSITFWYGQTDRVTITESRSLVSVHVDVMRVLRRTYSISRFSDSCVSFLNELYATCREVLLWFPSIELDFAFKCNCSMDAEEHFAIIDNWMNRDSKILCRQDREYQMNPEHKYWLPPAQLTLQPDIEDGKPTKLEIENIAKEVKIRGSTNDLAREMEVECDPEETSPEYAMISDWVMYEKGTRYKLAEHLREAGLTRVSTMLLTGDLQSPSDSSNTMMIRAPRKHDRPTLLLLLQFPTKLRKLNIIESIALQHSMLSTLLLNDDITKAVGQSSRDSFRITFEVLKQWIQGKGRTPITWETLVKVLESIDLRVLAREINDSLQ